MSGNLRTRCQYTLVAAGLALSIATPALATELQERLFGTPASLEQADTEVTAAKFSSPADQPEISRLQAILRTTSDKQGRTESAPALAPPPALLGEAPPRPGLSSSPSNTSTVLRLDEPAALVTEPKVAQRLQLQAPNTKSLNTKSLNTKSLSTKSLSTKSLPSAPAEVLEKPTATPTTASPPSNPFIADEDKQAPHVHRLSRPLQAVGIDTAPTAKLAAQAKKTPDALKIKNLAASAFGEWGAPAEEITHRLSRYPRGISIAWAAPASYHRPLYFEQPNLERYGHTVRFSKHGRGLLTQSAVSAAHFFATVPVLPYLVGAEGAPCERSYVLGSYRPGSCNPHQLIVPPINLRGALSQGIATTGLVFFIP